MAAKKKTAMEETDRFEALEEESRHMLGDPESLVVELIPQCVGCPHNRGAIECAVFGEKPSEYMANVKSCPKEKK